MINLEVCPTCKSDNPAVRSSVPHGGYGSNAYKIVPCSDYWHRIGAGIPPDGAPSMPSKNQVALWLEDYLNVLCEREAQDMSLPMRRFLNDRIDSVRTYLAELSVEPSGCPEHGMEHFFEGMCIKCGVVPAAKSNERRPCDWPDAHVQPCDCSVNEQPPPKGSQT